MFEGSIERISNLRQTVGLSYRHFAPPKPMLSEAIVEQIAVQIQKQPNVLLNLL